MRFIINEEEYGLNNPIETLEEAYFDISGYFIVAFNSEESFLEFINKYGKVTITAPDNEDSLPVLTFPED